MKINIPKIVRPLDLKDYAPEMNGAIIQVWVNPTRAFTQRFNDIRADDADLFSDWYAELFSQGGPDSLWTGDELNQVFESDPALWSFILTHAWDLITQHRESVQKK